MNHLANASSPYLLQHATNPVDWYPWGEAAFARARAEKKPIFLSIGYSTCHWCHVMAHESFENQQIAALLSEYFISIKVDREERPDVDRLYMTYVQALTGSGGWPLSVWLTPELKPFFGGTYFPPENRQGRVGFPSILLQLAQLWKENRSRLEQEATQAIEALQESVKLDSIKVCEEKKFPLQQAYAQFSQSFDKIWGGFGAAPKFPRPSVLFFLLRYAYSHKNDEGKQAQEMALLTLRKMAAGGLHDHLGGGFHRYSVDRIWQVPHFEKMLYDQAQLAMAYLEAWQNLSSHSTEAANGCVAPVLGASSTLSTLLSCAPSTPCTSSASANLKTGSNFDSEQYAAVVHDILHYVKCDMTSPEGGFYSAEDADSINEVGTKSEGAFYVWSEEEIRELLSEEEYKVVARYYGVKKAGNVPSDYDAQEELVGKNILIVMEDEVLSKADEKSLESARTKLFEARQKRPHPHRDEKILTAWNGLMISAYARAGATLAHDDYIEMATCAALFIHKNLYDRSSKELSRSWCAGRSTEQGFAEDYAFLIQGLLDLYEATFEVEWIQWAKVLQQKMDQLFWDASGSGYFSSAAGDPHLLMRMKEEYDGAEPSANSVAALNQLRFSRILNDEAAAEKTTQIFNLSAATLEGMPTAVPQLLVALWYSLMPLRQVVIAGELVWPDTQKLLAHARKGFHPDQLLMLAEGSVGQEWLAARNVALSEMKSVEGKAALYRCENFCCERVMVYTFLE